MVAAQTKAPKHALASDFRAITVKLIRAGLMGDLCGFGFEQGAGRALFQAAMSVKGRVIRFEPAPPALSMFSSSGCMCDAGVIAFEGLRKGITHSVRP